jgi:hypothetical protein
MVAGEASGIPTPAVMRTPLRTYAPPTLRITIASARNRCGSAAARHLQPTTEYNGHYTQSSIINRSKQ